MALTPSFSVSIQSDREYFSVADETVYGTDSNPARADLLVFLKGYKANYSNVLTELTTVGNDDDPATDSAWTMEYTSDGAYKFYYVAIPEFDSGNTYDQYDAVYSGAVVYRSKLADNEEDDLGNTTWWEVISDPAALAANKGESNESTNITSTIYLRVLSANGQWKYGNIISDQCACTDCDEVASLQDYNLFAMWLDCVAIADSRSEILDGELICRRIQSKFIDC